MLSLFSLGTTSGTVQSLRKALFPPSAPATGWPSSPIKQGIGIAACLGQASSPIAAGEMQPQSLGLQRGGKTPRKVLAPWEKPAGCLGRRQDPSECQLQALGMFVTQEQLRRTLHVMFTSSKFMPRQEHFLQHKKIKSTV